ncbi:MAG TPA: ATP-dependent zinc metalloprotease FtsH, partial [Ruminococcus sp.]|nr:ATP-dependent zinc metalloprotease FtsH [Ruminococcus sp.]
STGASNDLERATSTARSMVTRYGFSEKLGPIVYGNDQNEVFLGRDLGSSRDYSDRVAGEIDDEVRNIVEKAYDKATAILQMHMDQLELLAKYLMIHEKIEKDDFETLMQGKMDPSQFEETPAEPETSATEAEPTEEKPTENGDSSAPTEA